MKNYLGLGVSVLCSIQSFGNNCKVEIYIMQSTIISLHYLPSLHELKTDG